MLLFEFLGFNTFETINFNLLHFLLLDLKYNYLIIFSFSIYILIIESQGPVLKHANLQGTAAKLYDPK